MVYYVILLRNHLKLACKPKIWIWQIFRRLHEKPHTCNLAEICKVKKLNVFTWNFDSSNTILFGGFFECFDT